MQKQIVYSRHAKERISQRGIKERQVICAIENPQQTIPARNKKRTKVRYKFDGKTLTVIYVETPNQIIIITAMIT